MDEGEHYAGMSPQASWLMMASVARLTGLTIRMVKSYSDSPPADPDHIVNQVSHTTSGKKMRRYRYEDVARWVNEHTS